MAKDDWLLVSERYYEDWKANPGNWPECKGYDLSKAELVSGYLFQSAPGSFGGGRSQKPYRVYRAPRIKETLDQ